MDCVALKVPLVFSARSWSFVFSPVIRCYFSKSNSGLFQGTTSISFTFPSFCIVILFVVCQFEWNEFTINFTVTNRDETSDK